MTNTTQNNSQILSDWKEECLTPKQRQQMMWLEQIYKQSLHTPKAQRSYTQNTYLKIMLHLFLGNAISAGHPANYDQLTPNTMSDNHTKNEQHNFLIPNPQAWHSMLRMIQHLKIEQLQELAHQLYQTRTLEEKDDIITAMLIHENLRQKKHNLTAHKLVRNLAILGAVSVLGFGSAHAETKKQMAQTMVATAATTALAIEAHNKKKKAQERLNKAKKDLNQHMPTIAMYYDKISEIINK